MMSIADIKSQIATSKNIVIVTHKNPDGDAIGSSLGLYNYLIKAGKQAQVITPNDYPEFLKWMPGTETVMVFEAATHACKQSVAAADIIFCLDFNTLKRIDELGEEVRKAKAFKILIDHHQMPEDFANFMFHDVGACSTAQLVYDFIHALGDKNLIDEQSGICIYTGIMTDTASFRFPSVKAHTHHIAAELISKGVKHFTAHEKVYDSYSADRLRLLGYALSKLVVFPEYRTAYISLSKEELEKYNFTKGDTEGLVNYCLTINNIRFAAFFMERGDEIKISLRSKGAFDVNLLSRQHFSGGGHANAAGGEYKGKLTDAVKILTDLLPNYKTALLND
jgi:phosphoesterase RecJ-like protein